MQRNIRRVARAVLFGLGIVLLGCNAGTTNSGPAAGVRDDGSSAGESGAGALRGAISIDGSSTVAPLARAAVSAFAKEYPNVEPTIGISGTGGGFKRFSAGETDISNASRPIKRDEFELCAKNGVSFLELPVAYDGLSIVVHPQNDWAKQITVDQLRKIYREDGAISKWSELDPSWPDRAINVYAPGHQSGTYDYFREVMARDGEKPEDVVMRKQMSTNEDDNVLVTGVARDKYAIGFFGASYYFNNRDQVKAVKVVNPATGEAVSPTPEAVESGAYSPFSRPLFIYVNVKSLRRPEVKRFVDFFLEHAPELAKQVDYVGLSSEMQERVRERFEARQAGTHYLTAEGDKRVGGLPEVYRAENLRE